ncbi:MAG: hypothetical protein ACQESG_04225 [Nanobdellota archaeon]
MELLSLLFRIPTIFLAVAMGVFAYQVIVLTKGAMRGWVYLSLSGFALFLWATCVLVFTVIFPHDLLRFLSSAFFLFVMSFLVPLSYTRLAESFGVLPRWWNVPLFVGSLGFVIFVLLAFATTGEFGLQTLMSIAHFSLAIGMTLAVMPSFFLMKVTKKKPWLFAFLFCLIIAFALHVGQYYDNCCYEGSDFSDSSVCEGYNLDYVGIYSAPCISGLVAIGSLYQLFLLLGVVCGTISFFQVWRGLKAFK